MKFINNEFIFAVSARLYLCTEIKNEFKQHTMFKVRKNR